MTNKSPGVATIQASLIQKAVNRREAAMNRNVDQVLAGRASRYFD
jgi:hypothetical protein